MKKILCIAISILIIASSFIYISAYSKSEDENMSEIDIGINEYIDKVIGAYLYNSYNSDFALSYFKISNPYKISNNTSLPYRVYFVFRGKECIGELDVAYVNGEYSSVYYNKKIPGVTDAYINKTPLSVTLDGNAFKYVSEDQQAAFSASGNTELKKASALLVLSDINQSQLASVNSVQSPLVNTIYVPIVSNTTETVSGKGLCWAASAASIIGYETGTTLSAMNVYNKMKSRFSLPSCGYFEGSDIEKAFEAYSVGFDYSAYGMTYNDVKIEIRRGNPIYAGLGNWIEEDAHAVVLCGYMELDDGSNYYTLMDPNKESYVTSEAVNSTTIQLPYIATDRNGEASVVYSRWIAKGLLE